MKKYKTGHYETLKGALFTQTFPHAKNGGETNREEPLLGHDQEPQRKMLDELWEWIGNPDEY